MDGSSMSTKEHPERLRESFFGRLKGPTLRPGQARLLETELPRLRLDLEKAPPADVGSLFEPGVRAVRLEIGFGGGEHLMHESGRFRDVGFIGVEPYTNGMAKFLSALEGTPRDNIRLFDDDATRVLDWLPDRCLSGIDLFYPDPWPKTRHFKRRFVNSRNLDRMARVLMTGSLFRFASDIDTYVDWTLRHCRAHPQFDWTAGRADDWRNPFEAWPGTRYEAKAIREGRTPAYLTFRRR